MKKYLTIYQKFRRDSFGSGKKFFVKSIKIWKSGKM